MENLVSSDFWSGKRVLITGHTGFKGAWLSLWLKQLGAELHGFSLDPPTSPNLYDVAGVSGCFTTDIRADLADADAVRRTVDNIKPEIIFHLAAQPLVRDSYTAPIYTFMTNIMGTAHVLEAARHAESIRAVIIVTTDKVYENREWLYPYRENDPLGGHDPYSASKAAAELVTASYMRSFFQKDKGLRVGVATARAGNVIGGGDWAKDRLVPDCLRAFQEEKMVCLRFPNSVRPWQHVLEPLSGYLLLAEALYGKSVNESAWNFGPDSCSEVSVVAVAEKMAEIWGSGASVEVVEDCAHPHEAGLLRLDASLAHAQLGWKPRWSFQQALQATVEWHKAWLAREDMANVCRAQIDAYQGAPVRL